MIFSEITFLIFFLPFSVFSYYLTPRKYRNLALLILSFGFYFLLEPYFLAVMALGIVFNYFYSVLVEKYSEQKKLKTYLFILAVCFNLLILAGFVYIPTITGKFTSPIGVIFFVLNSLSYVTDIYKGNAKKAQNLVSFGVYSSFFPTILGGPILSYRDIAPQLEFRTENHGRTSEGIASFIRGLAKKVLISNRLYFICAEIKSGGFENLTTLSAWLFVISFGLTVYYELSAFSDMAVGLANIFGFNIERNFRHPLSSRSITSFFSKFNISLNNFLLNYIYTPLTKNHGKFISNLCLMLIFVLMSLFYGARLPLLFYGVYIGVLVIVEKNLLFKIRKKLPNFLSYILTYFFLAIGVPFFDAEIGDAFSILKSMLYFEKNLIYDEKALFLLLSNLSVIILAVFCGTKLPNKLSVKFYKKSPKAHAVINYIYSFILLFVSLCFMVSEGAYPFIFFIFS